MKNVTGKHPAATKRYIHRGFVVEKIGLGWRVWINFVQPSHEQKRCNTLAGCRYIINSI